MAISKKISPGDDDLTAAAPPDGGYGWVITMLAFINWFFCLGIIYSIGTLLDELVLVGVIYNIDKHFS